MMASCQINMGDFYQFGLLTCAILLVMIFAKVISTVSTMPLACGHRHIAQAIKMHVHQERSKLGFMVTNKSNFWDPCLLLAGLSGRVGHQ
jgi:hypothetical protein